MWEKATGPDEVPAELFKEGGETVLDRMHRICVAIWETGEWLEEWTFSTFIPLPKKGDLKQCANYRTIALVSHASKILLRIILERIRVKTETGGIPTRKGDKRSNHESQNTDAQGTRAPTTMCGIFLLHACNARYTTRQCIRSTFICNIGRSPVRAKGPAGCGHSKIARVCAYWVLYVVAAAD